MKKILLYGTVLSVLLSLPFWIMACRWIAAYEPGDYPPQKAYFATAEIYRALDSSEELTEKWASWLYVPGNNGSYPYEEYAVNKINEYIDRALAPGFAWHYRNLQITAGESISTPRNLAGADCSDCPTPRTYGGPPDNRIIFDTIDPRYRYVEIFTYRSDGTLLETIKVPIKYAEIGFGARPAAPVGGNWWVISEGRHLLFPDIYFALDDFDIRVEDPDGHQATVHISDCSLRNIGTVTAEYISTSGTYQVKDAKFYLYWNEDPGELRRFCVSNQSNLQAGGEASWCPPHPDFSFSLTLNKEDLEGLPILFKVHLDRPAGAGDAYDQHQPKVEMLPERTLYTNLPVWVPIAAEVLCDYEDGSNFARLYWIENYQDPGRETLLGTLTPPLSQFQQYYDNYGSHKLTAILYDTDGGSYAETMILNIRQQSLTIISPNGGECFEVSTAAGGHEQEISWNPEAYNGNVKLMWKYENNGHWWQSTIVESTANDGSYTWDLPLETHNRCRVVICDAATGTIGDESDDDFTITASSFCVAPTPITAGHYRGSLACAESDGLSVCGAPSDQPSVWYRFTAPYDGELRIDTCGTNDDGGVDLGMDTVLSLHSACPFLENDYLVVCNDDWPVRDNPPYSCAYDSGLIRDSLVFTRMMAGENTLIRLSKYASRANWYYLHVYYYPPICPGDFDFDSDIDGLDLARFAYLYLSSCPADGECVGDLDEDRDIDFDDLGKLANYFGNTGSDRCEDIE
jgi:hypothetical protein